MKVELKRYVVVLAAVALAILLGTMAYSYVTVRNRGRVLKINIDVYADAGLTQDLELVDWGVMQPGSAKNFSCYVFNPGNVPVNVSCYSDGWVPPAASTYISLDYFIEDPLLPPKSSRLLVFELTISPDIKDVDTFEFNIIVVGSNADYP